MKKFYCFYCQEDVKPHGFWLFRFCPNCHRHMTDKGEGFYKVCDVCNANLPTDASKCVRCGYHFNKESAVENFELGALLDKNTWLSWALIVVALAIGVILLLGIIYVSFYVIVAVVLFALIAMLFNTLRTWLHI